MIPENKIRLLLFVNSPVRAGVEEVVLSLARGLDRERFDVHLAAPRELLSSFQPDLNGSVKTLEVELQSPWQWAAMRRFVSYMRRERIQVVNSHLFCSTFFAAPLAKLAGVPTVIETFHGPEAWRRSWWGRKAWLDRLIELFVTRNIAVSEANRQYLITAKRFPPRKIDVVPNGRDLASYSGCPAHELAALRHRLGLTGSSRVVVVVGRLEEQKGHAYLLAALPEVVRRFPEVRLILVGDGSLRDRLEKRVADLNLGQHVIFAGYQRAVAPFYHLAEFVVLPSLYEGMPLTAIEAGAAGRAIVATDVDGTREVVVHGDTGLLVPPADPAALGSAICRLLVDPATARELGAAASARTQRLFEVQQHIRLTSQCYVACMSGRN